MGYRDDLEAAKARGEGLEQDLEVARGRVAELEAQQRPLSPQLQTLQQEALAKREKAKPTSSAHTNRADRDSRRLKKAPSGLLLVLHMLWIPAVAAGHAFLGANWPAPAVATLATIATAAFLYREATALRGRTTGVSIATRVVPHDISESESYSVEVDYSYEVSGEIQTGTSDVSTGTHGKGDFLDDTLRKYAPGTVVNVDYHLEASHVSRLHVRYLRVVWVLLSIASASFLWWVFG